MSDDSPWKPPATGEPDGPDTADSPASVDGEAIPSFRVESAPEPPTPSLWSREPAESTADGAPLVPLETSPPPFAPPSGPSVALFDVPTEVQTGEAEQSAGSGTRRSAKVVAVAAVALVAVGLAGIFAVRGLTGETTSGGATPAELGEELLDAIEGEDMLGVIDLLLPGERETLGEPFIATASELQRLEVLASDLDLASVAGIDVALAERVVSVESTNVGDVAHVRLAADATITVDGAEAPIGDVISDHVPEEEMTEMRGSRTTETESFDLELTAVEHDGRWYFSAWYSVAEAARQEAGLAEIPAEGVGSVGADSPEALLDRWVEQVEALDIRGMIQSLDPYEAGALQRYAPLFLDDAEAAVAEFSGVIDVTDWSFRFEGSGSSRTAFVESFAADVSEGGNAVNIAYADGCYRATWEIEGTDSESAEICGSDLDVGEQLGDFELPPEVEQLLQTITDAFADIEPIGAELRERDGQWYLSPIGTTSEAWLKSLRALDRAEIDAIVDQAQSAFEATSDELFGTDGSIGSMIDDALDDGLDDGASPIDEGWTDEGWTDDGAIDDGAIDDGAIDDGAIDDGAIDEGVVDTTIAGDPGATVDDPVSVCYETVDAGEATECFDELIVTGQAEEWMVPTVLRFPECGLADIMWSGDIYAATDEEFVELITTAKPCFEALVADGTLEDWELPYEVANFDCFENRNWYATFDDPEYNDRVLECLDL